MQSIIYVHAYLLDYMPDMQLVPYSQNTQTQSFGLSNMSSFETEFTYETGCHGKGRRTVKGISNNSLPLETTLRVVSELGPTLRMERGKVIRISPTSNLPSQQDKYTLINQLPHRLALKIKLSLAQQALRGIPIYKKLHFINYKIVIVVFYDNRRTIEKQVLDKLVHSDMFLKAKKNFALTNK
ncbi:hypothetical protein E2986_12023 [Frieseomelitta varia]|uniref:Uncharacterized protein n=1 Tax=Frieseomelitta varia TaxID=561572 RepID=A0A833RXJ2_9HYME|nr:hypothetical protein E2986_12023 [Frieseomelitta varia]